MCGRSCGWWVRLDARERRQGRRGLTPPCTAVLHETVHAVRPHLGPPLLDHRCNAGSVHATAWLKMLSLVWTSGRLMLGWMVIWIPP